MPENEKQKPFIIVGGGLAAASAVEGIRELDQKRPILLFGAESALPYDRPPLSKKLWSGQMTLDEVFVHPASYYKEHGVEVRTGTRVSRIDPLKRQVMTDRGDSFSYDKLLIATGGRPRKLDIPGGDLPGISYFRTLDDYTKLRQEAASGKSALVLGGGFIGSEIAAALSMNQVHVTILFPSEYLVDRVFPKDLGRALTAQYASRGIRILTQDKPVQIEKEENRFLTRTEKGEILRSDLIIAGLGITPDTEIAASAGIKTTNGIEVDEQLCTSDPNVFAAGDCCNFPYLALGKRMRVEHWDNAKIQGKQAGRNMAGARERYGHMPFFFSDLFEFGYEAVGEVDSRLDTYADWTEENKTGTIYYLRDGVIRGAMMCNVWEKVDWARDLIRRGEKISALQIKRTG